MATATQKASSEAYQRIELNKTQYAVLKGLINFVRQHRTYPRYKELAKFLNMDRITVSSRLVELRQKGCIQSFKNSSLKKLGCVSLITEKGVRLLKEVSNV